MKCKKCKTFSHLFPRDNDDDDDYNTFNLNSIIIIIINKQLYSLQTNFNVHSFHEKSLLM